MRIIRQSAHVPRVARRCRRQLPYKLAELLDQRLHVFPPLRHLCRVQLVRTPCGGLIFDTLSFGAYYRCLHGRKSSNQAPGGAANVAAAPRVPTLAARLVQAVASAAAP